MQTLPTIDSRAEQRMVLDLPWSGFLSLLDSLGNHRAVRLAYSDGLLELMMPLEVHEIIRCLLNSLVEAWADHYALDYTPLGSWTIRREDLEKSIEPDGCFYIQSVDYVRGRRKLDLSQLPPPDLAIEVDITSSSKLRQPIYQALGVPELWRWTGESLTIYHLIDGKYETQPTSRLQPLSSQKLSDLVQYGLANTPSQAKRQLRQWLTDLAP